MDNVYDNKERIGWMIFQEASVIDLWDNDKDNEIWITYLD